MNKIKKAKKMVRSLIIVCEILLLALFWFEIVNSRLVKMPYEIPSSSIYVEYVNIDYGYTKAELKTKIENLTGQRWYIYREKELEPFTYGQTYIMLRWVEISEDLDLDWKSYDKCKEIEVSKSGKIRNAATKQLLGSINTNGYVQYKDSKNGVWYLVHRIVMETFNPVDDMNTLYVDHINGIRTDNRLENLRWVSQQENMIYRNDNWGAIQNNINLAIQKFGYEEFNKKLEALLNKEDN